MTPPSPPGAVERPRLWPARPSTPPGGDGHCLRIRCETWLGAYGSRFPSSISRRRMRPFGARFLRGCRRHHRVVRVHQRLPGRDVRERFRRLLPGAPLRRGRQRARRAPTGAAALRLEPGDEVIVPAMTFVATCEAVTQAGPSPCRSTSPRRLQPRSAPWRPRYGRDAGDRAGAPLRPDGRHDGARALVASATGSRRRGRRAGPRRLARRTSRRGPRTRRGVQLLSRQEPRRDGRRRRRSSPTTPSSRDRSGRSASTASARSTTTTDRAARPGSTRSRRPCCSASSRSSTAGTTSGADRRRSTDALDGVGDLGCRRSPRAASRSGTCTWSGRRIRRRSRPPAGAGIARGRHYPEPPHLTGVRAPRPPRRRRSRSQSRSPASASRCRSSRA